MGPDWQASRSAEILADHDCRGQRCRSKPSRPGYQREAPSSRPSRANRRRRGGWGLANAARLTLERRRWRPRSGQACSRVSNGRGQGQPWRPAIREPAARSAFPRRPAQETDERQIHLPRASGRNTRCRLGKRERLLVASTRLGAADRRAEPKAPACHRISDSRSPAPHAKPSWSKTLSLQSQQDHISALTRDRKCEPPAISSL